MKGITQYIVITMLPNGNLRTMMKSKDIDQARRYIESIPRFHTCWIVEVIEQYSGELAELDETMRVSHSL